jgi:hypothetical protein
MDQTATDLSDLLQQTGGQYTFIHHVKEPIFDGRTSRIYYQDFHYRHLKSRLKAAPTT